MGVVLSLLAFAIMFIFFWSFVKLIIDLIKHRNVKKSALILIGSFVAFFIVGSAAGSLNDKSASSNSSSAESSSYSSSDGDDLDEDDTSSSSSEKTPALSDYKTGVSYNDLQNDNDYNATYVAFPMKIIEVHDDLSVLAAMNYNENDKIMVNIPADNMDDDNLKVGSTFTAYGMNTPSESYKTKSFGKISVPVLLCDTLHYGTDSGFEKFIENDSSSNTSSNNSPQPALPSSSSYVSSSEAPVASSSSTDSSQVNNTSSRKWAIQDGYTWATRKGHSTWVEPGGLLPSGYHWER